MSMMNFGFEKEYFLLKDEEVCVVPSSLPADECGWLVEARGKPFSSPREAVFSLLAEEDRLKKVASKKGYELLEQPVLKVPRDLEIAAQKRYAKGRLEYENLYGYQRHRNTRSEKIASLQVTFGRPQTAHNEKGSYVYNAMFDFPQAIRFLDNAFKEEIKESKRRPGFYEMKRSGLVEYRSLPNNVHPRKLIDVLEEMVRKLHS